MERATPVGLGRGRTGCSCNPRNHRQQRELHGMAYDFASKQLLVFGGEANTFLNDAWSLVSQ